MNTAGVKAKERILNFIHIIFQARCNGFCLELDDGCDDIVVKRNELLASVFMYVLSLKNP